MFLMQSLTYDDKGGTRNQAIRAGTTSSTRRAVTQEKGVRPKNSRTKGQNNFHAFSHFSCRGTDNVDYRSGTEIPAPHKPSLKTRTTLAPDREEQHLRQIGGLKKVRTARLDYQV
jgi:hypothetical protein